MTSDAWCRGPAARTCLNVRPIVRRKVWSVTGRVLRGSKRLAAIALIGGSINTAASIPAAAQPRDRMVADILEFHIVREAEQGRVPSHRVLTGTLGAGESDTAQVHTCSGTEYKAVGMCDFDCSDLDLTAYDATAEVMDSDVLPDAVPMVHFTPTACGFTTLSVKMVECNGSCEWAVQLYIDDPTAPSGVPGAGNADSPAWSSDWGPLPRDLQKQPERRHYPSSRELTCGLAAAVPAAARCGPECRGRQVSPMYSGWSAMVSSADGERVRFVVNDTREVTAVFIAGQEIPTRGVARGEVSMVDRRQYPTATA